MDARKEKGRPLEESGQKDNFKSHPKQPSVSGQAAEVMEVLKANGSVPSLHLTATLAIPEAAARIYDLRSMGFNINTLIVPRFVFRGRVRRRIAIYSLGTPVWPAPGFLVEGGER